MKRAYRTLLRLYPRDHRDVFAAEMLVVFEQALEECRAGGWAVFLRFALAELFGLLIGAGAEWTAKFTRSADRAARTVPEEGMEAQRQIEFNIRRMEYAISHHDFAGARFHADQERKARERLRLPGEEREG